MITENLEQGFIKSGTGRKFKFDTDLYLKVTKFICDKFDMTIEQAKTQLNYYIVTNRLCNTNKKATNARLNNIIELDYEWSELFNINI